jgi:hypothetical protein
VIKRILALRYVCKKYDLKYKLKLFGDVGWIGFADKNTATDYEFVCVSLLSNHFWSILFHEVGHLIAKRTLNYQWKHCNALGIDYKWGPKEMATLIAEEATASKFSNRMTKRSDNQYLKQCWHTYTADAAKRKPYWYLETYISTVNKYNKYFEGN